MYDIWNEIRIFMVENFGMTVAGRIQNTVIKNSIHLGYTYKSEKDWGVNTFMDILLYEKYEDPRFMKCRGVGTATIEKLRKTREAIMSMGL